MNEHMFATGEHSRMLANLVLLGTIDEVDADAKCATVNANGLTTDWLPWVTRRAGPDSDWCAPEPGEQVVVLCAYGDPSQGVIIGSLYQDKFPAPAADVNLWRKRFSDGSTITYDRKAHALTVDVGAGSVVVNCKSATVTASDSVTLDAPNTHCTGALTVDGDTALKGNASVQGSATLKGVTSNGIDISNAHKHGNGNGGAPTTAVLG